MILSDYDGGGFAKVVWHFLMEMTYRERRGNMGLGYEGSDDANRCNSDNCMTTTFERTSNRHSRSRT